jgi:membrane associated rhomboid family serine protease
MVYTLFVALPVSHRVVATRVVCCRPRSTRPPTARRASTSRVLHAPPRASASLDSVDDDGCLGEGHGDDGHTDDALAPSRGQDHYTDTPLASPARLLSDVLIGANICIFFIQVTFPELHLTERWVNVHELVDRGELYRLVSACFLHGSFSHLLLNMLSLHSLGSLCEWTCGKNRFLAIYLLSGIGGNLASYAATSFQENGDQIASLGASGAIFGVAGALIVYFGRNKVLYRDKSVPSGMVTRLVTTVSANFLLGSVLPNIDEAGHWGGLIAGMFLAWVLGPHYELCRLKGRSSREVWLVDDSVFGGKDARLVYRPKSFR